MDIVAIDPSLICTAVVVNDVKFVYVGSHISHTEKGKQKRWFEEFCDIVCVRPLDLSFSKQLTYSQQENVKIDLYIKICETIISDICSNVSNIKTTKVAIEGYSYSSSAGPLIDLVTFGSILRKMLRECGVSEIIVVPPQELKTKAASLVYAPVVKGKVVKYVNKDGKSAGSFKKPDMMQCLLDDSTLIKDAWVDRLRLNSDELLALKTTPKPVEDVNDAKLLYEWLKRNI